MVQGRGCSPTQLWPLVLEANSTVMCSGQMCVSAESPSMSITFKLAVIIMNSSWCHQGDTRLIEAGYHSSLFKVGM